MSNCQKISRDESLKYWAQSCLIKNSKATTCTQHQKTWGTLQSTVFSMKWFQNCQTTNHYHSLWRGPHGTPQCKSTVLGWINILFKKVLLTTLDHWRWCVVSRQEEVSSMRLHHGTHLHVTHGGPSEHHGPESSTSCRSPQGEQDYRRRPIRASHSWGNEKFSNTANVKL
jgi:hypothetical protein